MLGQSVDRDIVIVVRRLDMEKGSEAVREELVAYHDHALPVMLDMLPNLRSWQARNAVIYTAIKFSRRFAESRTMGVLGLGDKSVRVRQTACALAAFSLNDCFLEHLKRLIETHDDVSAVDAHAALSAIRGQNHHLFLDRNGSGRVFWNVMGSGVSD